MGKLAPSAPPAQQLPPPPPPVPKKAEEPAVKDKKEEASRLARTRAGLGSTINEGSPRGTGAPTDNSRGLGTIQRKALLGD
jgi:hypothetical protein